MLQQYKNQSLLKYNTFNVESKALNFVEFENENELHQYLHNYPKHQELFILGGGSNVLFVNDFNGIIIHPMIIGIKVVSESTDNVTIEVGAGVIWDDFVSWAVYNNFSGIENLSHIPGSVGATPVQNIGAYGVEVKDIIERVDGINIKQNSVISFSPEECKFEYRNSIFKNELKNQIVITKVYFKLFKKHKYNLEYGNIKSELSNYDEVNLKNIRSAIIKIRTSKLPDPKDLGNAGSFFKNPILLNIDIELLIKKYPDMPVYNMNENSKIAAGWLIEQCGWKGKTISNASVYKDQALVIINTGTAKGIDIYNLSKLIIKSVWDKFNISLEREVIII